MSFLAWIVLGLLAGFIGSKLVNKTGEGAVLDIVRWPHCRFCRENVLSRF